MLLSLHLHSTMLLLYLFCFEIDNSIILIYIPLCFYYIGLVHPVQHQENIHLHSTMLLLYQWNRRESWKPCIYLHSTMLLLYHSSFLHRFVVSSSFTFHYASTISRLGENHYSGIIDLHSTMLLLYPFSGVGYSPMNPIYIPLCFYYIRYPEEEKSTCIGIYIPLCFYYILVLLSKPFALGWNLHSTMLLLYPPLRLWSMSPRIIYIPLCFYYIKPVYDQEDVCVWFTFHYASTISAHPGEYIPSLHIYIPLCFYYIA